jgi:phosphohistidine phosphatase SixA
MPILAVLAFVANAAFIPPDSAELRGEDLMKALSTGGYTILLRHARTDHSFQEAIGTIPVERSAQRNLSAEGVRDAALMGVVLRKYHIPIGEIIASPMFRARETAEMAAGNPTISMALRVFPSTDEQAALVAAAPKPGTNRLLVTHHFVIEKHVPGITPGEIGESEAAIVRRTPDGHVAFVGRISLADWERLAGVPAQAVSQSAPAPVQSAATSYGPVESSTTIPNTPAGQVAQRYITAFSSGDPARMREFIESSLVANPARPTEARLQTFTETFQRFGPLTVTGIRASSAEEISINVRAKGGDFIVTAKVAPDQPGRAASITIGTLAGGHP